MNCAILFLLALWSGIGFGFFLCWIRSQALFDRDRAMTQWVDTHATELEAVLKQSDNPHAHAALALWPGRDYPKPIKHYEY